MSTLRRQPDRAQPLAHLHASNPDDAAHSPDFVQANQTTKAVRRSSRITLGGLIYVFVTLFLAVGAINSQNNLLFWLFGVCIATLIVSGIFSGNALMQIRVLAQAIPDGHAGDELKLHYTITNNSRFFPLFAAMITELDGDNQPIGERLSAAITHVGPRQTIRVTGTMHPQSRGRFGMRRFRLSTRFPFGFLQKSLDFECHRPMMILPYRLELKQGLVRVVHGRGEEVHKRTDSSGVSSEYWGLREYTPGDPKRSIAWKQSARQRKLVVIEHAQPIATKLWVWLSTESHAQFAESDPDHAHALIERAIALGAGLVKQASNRDIPVGIWAPGFGIRIYPSAGKAHTMRCMRALGMIDLDEPIARDAPPRASNADDVIAIRSGLTIGSGLTGSHGLHASGNLRTMPIEDPSRWLLDPASLPASLGGEP